MPPKTGTAIEEESRAPMSEACNFRSVKEAPGNSPLEGASIRGVGENGLVFLIFFCTRSLESRKRAFEGLFGLSAITRLGREKHLPLPNAGNRGHTFTIAIWETGYKGRTKLEPLPTRRGGLG